MLFKEFEEKEQRIIYLTATVISLIITGVGIFAGFKSFSKFGIIVSIIIGLISLAIGLTINVVGYSTALLHKELSLINDRIDLQIRKAGEDEKRIAEHLEVLIELSKQEPMKKKVRKSLNGVVQALTLKGIEEKNLRVSVLNYLMKKEWKKAISVSTYGSPMEWMDPYWFTYLSLQIGRAAELKKNEISAKRYFIYKKKVVDEYLDELKLLIEAHNNYIQPFLYFTEDVKKSLKKRDIKRQKMVLTDCILIEYDAEDKKILWRNPNKNGEVEEADGSKAQSIVNLIQLLEAKESILDKKGVLQI